MATGASVRNANLADYLHLSASLTIRSRPQSTRSSAIYPTLDTNVIPEASIHKTTQIANRRGQFTLTSPNGGLFLPIPNRS